MVQAFTEHCVKRYGIAEVGGWKFEVWNEPNIVFWAGTQDQYFELYRQSALAIKSVDKRLQVGGPVHCTIGLDSRPYPVLRKQGRAAGLCEHAMCIPTIPKSTSSGRTIFTLSSRSYRVAWSM